ncbi:MAG: hypothetical protein HZB53_12580 [Chloroflexi bacterium]|nr:hypothetical protein [Chloroflexota bacterium]
MRIRETLTPRNTLALLLPVALFVLAVQPVSDPDLWWHMRSGQWIGEHGAVPTADFFSFTAAGTPWMEHEWLANTALYALFVLGGLNLLSIVAGAIITATFVGVYRLSVLRPHLAVFTTIVAALATAFTWDARPQILTMLLAVVVLLVLRRARTGRLRWLALLPPIMWLWINVHSGFVFGFVVIATALFGDTLEAVLASRFGGRVPPPDSDTIPSRRYLAALALAGIASLALTLANPYGVGAYLAPLGTLGNRTIPLYIAEWRPPDLHNARFLPFAALWLGLMVALAFSRRRPALTDLLYVIGFGYAAWLSARFIPLFAVIAAPLLTRQVAAWRAEPPASAAPPALPPARLARLNAAALALLLLATLVQVASTLLRAPESVARQFPVGAADYILRERPAGPLLNSYNFGGYLIWRLYPDYPVFIDGRAEYVYGDRFIAEYYDRIWLASGDWQAYLDRYGVRLVVMEKDGALGRQLAQSPAWQRLYADDTAVVFQKRAAP